MRLQVAAVVAALGLFAGPAGADERAAGWVSVYTDDDGLVVVSPQVSARGDATETVELSAGYDVDVITAASVDVISAASPRGYAEERHGLTLGVSWGPEPGTSIGYGWLPSFEPDYRSNGHAVSASREWFERRLTTRIDYRLSFDAVGRSGDARALFRPLRTHALGASVGWIFDPSTVGDLLYEVQSRRGFQASPYRFVPIYWDGSESAMVQIAEAVPNDRVTHAAALQLRRALGKRWFTGANYRFYGDTWGVVSHTGRVSLEHQLTDQVILGTSLRAQHQGPASFYRARYEVPIGEVPAYRAMDKTLAASRSLLAGLRAELGVPNPGPFEQLWLTLQVDLYDQRFFDFPRLAGRRALVVSLGTALEL